MSQFQKDSTFTWIMKHFSLLRRIGLILSPPFFAENIGSKWDIQIHHDSNKEFVNLRLNRSGNEEEVKALTLDVKIELCNSQNEVLCVTEKKRGIKILNGEHFTFEKVMLWEEFEEKWKADPGDTLLLRCWMWETGKGESAGETSSSSSIFKTAPCSDEELSYIRDVDYSESPDWSKELNFTMNEGILNVNIKARQDDILFEFGQNFDQNNPFYNFKCKISLLNRDRTVKISSYKIFTPSSYGRIKKFPSFLKRSFLEEGTDKLLLKFHFLFSNKRVFHSRIDETKLLSPLTKATNSLIGDFRKMLSSQEHADVSFSVGSEVMGAHKNVLATRSPVFSAMFKQEMAESETGVIYISDMDAQTLKLFLEFLYTGELEDSDWERMLELLLAAEKYQVLSLKEKCSQFLKCRFTPDNVCDLMSVADMVGEQALKAAAMDYIKGNVAKVFSSPKWSVLADKNAKLCSEIICKFSEELKENDRGIKRKRQGD